MRWYSSLKYRIVALASVSAFFIAIIIIGYNSYILKMKDNDYSRSLKNTLTLYCEGISTSLDQLESFLLTKCMNEEDIQKISEPRDEIDRYLSLINMKTNFYECMNNYNMIDGLFLYDPKDDVFVVQTKDRSNETIQNNVTSFTEKFHQVSKTGDNEWFWVKIDDTYYFTRMFVLKEVYVASYVKISTIIDSLQEIALGETDYVVFCDRDGAVLDIRLEPFDIQLNQQKFVMLEKNKYINLQVIDKSDHFSLAILNEKQEMFGYDGIVGKQLFFAFIVISCIGLFSVFIIQKLFHLPINDLILAMNQIKAGNLDINMRKDNVFDEFKVVNETVESMAHEIKKLKIDVYEEVLNKQKVELLYLQEQINPHFLINCINLIRNLSIVGENEKIQEVSVLFSKYIRYSLRTSTMISLERELDHVYTYEKIQKICYGDRLKIVCDVQQDLLENFVPTMLIQTFVDNSVKHQMEPEGQLLITINIKETVNMNGESGINIWIQDSGDGFNQEVLETLRSRTKLESDVGERIGIHNVCQRVEILYDKKATIDFFNAKEGGAVVDINLPNNKNTEKY